MDDPSPASVADRLARELEQSAELVDHGSFDIDAGRALDKLAQFQLADPSAYVLRLAEAGLLARASRLRFNIAGMTVRMSFDHGRDPVVIPGPALERLLSVLISRSPIPSGWPPRALLVQLAIGVLAALRLEPSYLAIESVAADGRGHRQVFSGEPRLETLTRAEPGTRIYLREKISVRGRVDGVLGERPEQALLREHCRHARTPIFLDGRLISQQPVFSEPKLAASVVDERGVVTGEAGFVAGPPTPARVLLLANGLLIESLNLLDCQPNFLAAIDVPLPRDLSQAAIARTAELDTALAPVYTVHAQLAPLAPTAPQQAAAKQPHPALLVVWPLTVFAFVALLELPSGRLGPKLTLAVVLPILCVVLLLMWAGKKWK